MSDTINSNNCWLLARGDIHCVKEPVRLSVLDGKYQMALLLLIRKSENALP